MTRTAHPRIAEGLEDACWDGYEAVGMKEKDGKQVPNCVPTKTASHDGAMKKLRQEFPDIPPQELDQLVGSVSPRMSPEGRKVQRRYQQLTGKTAAHRLDGVRGHQLLPSTLARKLPPIYSQEDVEDPLVQVKLFSPYSGAVWYLTEYDPASRDAFGWADLGMGGGELGYISVSELEGLNRGGLPLVERDLYWKPVPLSKAKGGRMASSKYPSVVREVEDDYKRKAITRGEREELLSAISGASSKQEAERIVSEHRKGRAASVRVAARYIANRIP